MSTALFRIWCLFGALAALLGACWAEATGYMKVADPTVPTYSNNFYNYTFAHYEPPALLATALFFLALCLCGKFINKMGEGTRWLLASRRLPLLVSLSVFVIACMGRFGAHQNFDLCIDEYLNEFEVGILQQQHLVAELPSEWISDQKAMRVGYQIYHGDAVKGYWASGFLPGFAFLDYLFDSLGIGWALGAALAAVSLLFLAALVRRAFPDDDRFAANIAVLLLACSPQFLVMAFTKFAWPAHLCGTLLWVWLFTHPRKTLFLLTPIVGAFLIGLHQPQVHLLVAAPFLLRLVYTFRWKAVLWFGAWYLAGIAGWYKILVLLRPTLSGPGGELANMGFPFLLSFFVTICHTITFYAWTTPALPLLAGLALVTWKRQPPLVHDSLVAAAITFFFYMSFPHVQGHGWGARYMHPAYGLLALAAAGGAVTLSREFHKPASAAKMVLLSLLFSLVIQMPWRIQEVITMVRPLSRAWTYIATRPVDFVILETSEFWYARDLIRNDPWLKRKPFVFDAEYLTANQKSELARRGSVMTVGANEVRSCGVILPDPSKKPSPSDR